MNDLIIQNIIFLSVKKSLKELRYSDEDVSRIILGEVLLPPIELNRIANLFNVSKEELMLKKCTFIIEPERKNK